MEISREDVINKLTTLSDDLQELLERKYKMLEDIKEEIKFLKLKIKDIDGFINSKSITSAIDLIDTISYLEQRKTKNLKNIDFTRKIFSKTQNLLIDFRYDGENIEVFFPNSDLIKLETESTVYLTSIISPLMSLTEEENDLTVEPHILKETGYLNKITIKNVYKFENAQNIFAIFEGLVKKLS